MSWHPYELDNRARNLVRQQTSESIKESHKMRQMIAYGLERFWGEQLRLADDEPSKANYWQNVWNELVSILATAGVQLPQHQNVDRMAEALWDLSLENQQIAIAVLTQFCDCLVWWTQRYQGFVPE